MHFNWITSCDHANTADTCLTAYSPYSFLFKCTDNHCAAPATNYSVVNVVIRDLIVYQSGNTLYVTAPYPNLQWLLNGNPILNATDSFYVATTPGTYSVQSTLAGGCVLYAHHVSAGNVGIYDYAVALQHISIIPNPVSDKCTINAKDFNDAMLTVHDVTGRNVISKPFHSSIILNTHDLPQGVFIAELKDGSKKVFRKFIKEYRDKPSHTCR